MQDADENTQVAQPRSPLIFISHDTRDAELAEAFSKLLGSVSAGVLKAFRSSDKKGSQGIEYGVEWYPEIMRKLESASDVVCLLTPNSVGRPWILYEAGVAKGKLDTPVHGLAIGVTLTKASVGPFAQFQNSDDSVDALVQLVMQLVRRIPGAEPDREVVKYHVETFREAANQLVTEPNLSETGPKEESSEASVVKLFEEVKVMFQDLPSRIDKHVSLGFDPRSRRSNRIPFRFFQEFVHTIEFDSSDGLALLVATSQVKEDYPWPFCLASDIYTKSLRADSDIYAELSKFEQIIITTMSHPAIREHRFRRRESDLDLELVFDIWKRMRSKTRIAKEKKQDRENKKLESDESGE